MDNLLKTSVDDLHELVKSRGKISVEEAAKVLRLPINVVHSLVDFFVEEKLFGIEYKFTTPYIYISQNHPKEKSEELSFSKGLFTKEEFFERVKKSKMPFESGLLRPSPADVTEIPASRADRGTLTVAVLVTQLP